MTRTYNAQQAAYMMAKAQLEVIKEQANEIERKYIADHNIVNPDGSIPTAVYCIDDESAFDQANEATAPAIEALGIYAAEQTFKAAEDALINYGLSIMPACYNAQRETLRNACFGLNGYTYQLKIRKGVLENALKLDVRTVRV